MAEEYLNSSQFVNLVNSGGGGGGGGGVWGGGGGVLPKGFPTPGAN
ncbi:hypothetical protein M5Z47_10460 [Neisseria meningitidis]|nr:hypothetical protein [Neisseria meningitidis]